MKLEALIFDVDGTLADTEEVHRQAFNAAFIAHGLSWYWSVGAYAHLLKIAGGKERLRGYVESLDVPTAEKERLRRLVPRIHETKTRLYADLIELGRAPLRPGVETLIHAARASGVRLAVASTTSAANVTALITATLGAQALHWFAVIATGDLVAKKKPAADIYRFALAALDASPAQCVAFEDSEPGVLAAKAAGLFTVATPSSWTLGENLGAADIVLRSLADLDWSPHPAAKPELDRIARLQLLEAVAADGAATRGAGR